MNIFNKNKKDLLIHPPHSEILFADKINILEKIGEINWKSYETAYGDGSSVGEDLKLLMLGSKEQAMDSIHHLWCSLCHQYVETSSAAEPALPFILDAEKKSNYDLRVEILDVILGFIKSYDENKLFSVRILEEIKNQKNYFSENEDQFTGDGLSILKEINSLL